MSAAKTSASGSRTASPRPPGRARAGWAVSPAPGAVSSASGAVIGQPAGGGLARRRNDGAPRPREKESTRFLSAGRQQTAAPAANGAYFMLARRRRPAGRERGL